LDACKNLLKQLRALQSISEQKNLDKQYGVVYSNGVRTGLMALAVTRVVTPPLALALEGLFFGGANERKTA